MDSRQLGRHRRPQTIGPDVPANEIARTDPGLLRWVGIAAVAEATTLLLLVGVAVPLKHVGDWPLAVRVLGPIHGFAFIAYVWLILQTLGAGHLSRGGAARLVLSAFVPFGGYLAAHLIAGRASKHPDRGSER